MTQVVLRLPRTATAVHRVDGLRRNTECGYGGTRHRTPQHSHPRHVRRVLRAGSAAVVYVCVPLGEQSCCVHDPIT